MHSNTSAPLTRLSLLILLAVVSLGALPAAAQQLPNSGFENWKGSCGKTDAVGEMRQRPGDEPTGWNGSSVNQKVLVVKKETLIFDENVNVHSGTHALKLQHKFVGILSTGSVAPGFITFGTPWVYAEMTIDNCDGGVYGGINFTHRPDAVSLYIKKTDNGAEKPRVIFYSWKGTFTSKIGKKNAGTQDTNDVDRAIFGDVTTSSEGTLIGSVKDYEVTNANSNSWTYVEAPIEYASVDKPEKMNLIVSAGNYWNRGQMVDGTTAIVDDIKLLYYSRLKAVSVKGTPLTFGAENTAVSDQYVNDIDLNDISYELEGEGKSAEVNIDKDSEANTIVITVTNHNGVDADGLSEHVYRIRCKTPRIEEIYFGQTKIDLNTLTYANYLPEDADINVTMGGVEGSAVITRDEDASTITVAMPEGTVTDQPTSYTIQCWKPVSEIIFPEAIPAEMLTGDVVTFRASDFGFAPEGAAEAEIERLEADKTSEAVLTYADGVYTLKANDPCTVILTAVSKNGYSAAKEIEVKPRPLVSIAFKEAKYGIVKGKERRFSVSDLVFNPENAYDKSFEFSVTDEGDAATKSYNDDHSEVTITPYEQNPISITVTSKVDANVTATASIEVGDQIVVPAKIKEAEGFDVPKTLYIGEMQSLTIPTVIYPENYNVGVTTTWTSDNEAVLAVDAASGAITFAEGAVPAKAVNVTVTASFKNENEEAASVAKTFTFEVRQPVTSLKWQDAEGSAITQLEMKQHETPVAHAFIAPETASDKSIAYTIEPEGIISYDEATGTITATGYGRATITATATNDATADNGRQPVVAALDVAVTAMPVEITINGYDHYWVGKEFQLSATIEPEAASAAILAWSSSNPDVATVDESGLLTVLAEGETTILARAANGTEGGITINAETYKGISRSIDGWMTVTDAQGEVNTVETTVTFATTSPSEMDLSIEQFSIKGLRLGTVNLYNATYSSISEGADGHTAKCNVACDDNEVSVMNGSIRALVSIAGGSEADFAANTAELTIAITVPDWDNEKATAVFSTTKPDEPENPEQPDVPAAGTVTKYPGTISFTVAPENEGEESVKYDLDVIVTVTDKGETDAEGNSIVSIDFPALRFHKYYYDSYSRSDDEEGFYYVYDYAPFTLTDVVATRSGTTTTYIRERGPVAVTLADGTADEYMAGLSGSATDAGVARMALTLGVPGSDTDIKGSFSNTQAPAGEVYDGKLTIEMGGQMLTEGDGQDATVNIVPDEAGTSATFILPNFTLASMGLSLGDIRVDNVTVDAQEDGTRYYSGSVSGMVLADGQITADVELSGTVTADNMADMNITVMWNGIPINVHFTGELSSSTSGISAPSMADDDNDARSEWFTLTGVRVDGSNLAPGIYIERSGGRSRKVLVR